MKQFLQFLKILTVSLFALTTLSAVAFAEVYHVKLGASVRGDGSAGNPWDSITAAVRSQKLRGGDVVKLGDGFHGRINFVGFRYDSPVIFEPEDGATVRFAEIVIGKASNMTFRNIQVWPNQPQGNNTSFVRVGGNAPNIVFENVDLRSVENASGYVSWSRKDWLRNQASGFLLLGPNNEVRNSTITGIGFAIAVTGKGARVINNRVNGFSGDGIRVLGDDSIISGNIVRDCVKIDGNHDDGIQSWTLGKNRQVGGGVLRNLVIEGNLIQEWSGNQNHPLICDLQGMLFGHQLDNLMIRNNVVAASAFHGISAAGIRSGQIVHNTLVNSRGPSQKSPWIGVLGGPGRNVVVANNIAPVFNVPDANGYKAPAMRNIVSIYPDRDLRAPYAGDFRPKPGRLIDAANPSYAPKADIDGTPRPLGAGPDIGAYEVK